VGGFWQVIFPNRGEDFNGDGVFENFVAMGDVFGDEPESGGSGRRIWDAEQKFLVTNLAG
jgi:hypothetical protein